MKLDLHNISVEVDGTEVVHDVSLSLTSGTVAVLMGKNGSGKSSLVNALMGHPSYAISAGRLLLDDDDITALAPDKKAQKGLYLSLQHTPNVGGVTLATFLHKAYEAVQCRTVPALEFYLECKTKAETLGLESTLLDRPLAQGLSGGEKKQSEALQLAILAPRFAFLDETDSGVDISALGKVFAAIQQAAANGTGVLLISHHPSLLTHLTPTHVYVMERGVLVQSGDATLAAYIAANGFSAE